MRASGLVCPQGEEHGRLLPMPSGNLYCPSVRHRGRGVYDVDLAPAPRPAVDKPRRRGGAPDGDQEAALAEL